MPIRVLSVISKKDVDMSLPPVVLAPATSTDVFDSWMNKKEELVIRELFNNGANPALYRYGGTCDVTNYNGVLVAGQMLEVPVAQRVSMYSTGGTTIARTQIKRDDLAPHANMVPS